MTDGGTPWFPDLDRFSKILRIATGLRAGEPVIIRASPIEFHATVGRSGGPILGGIFRNFMNSRALVAKNRRFYDAFWAQTYLTRPERFNTWPLISGLLPSSPRRLEIGPGMRPRLPVAGTNFLDLSPPVVDRLNDNGGLARVGEITALPYADSSFDLITAFDVIEHVENDGQVFRELARVLKPDGRLIFSVPLHPAFWTTFDDYVGHARRYEPVILQALLEEHGLVVEQSAVFGMQSNSPRLLHYAVLGLTRHPVAALHCYNWLFFPLGRLFQQRLKISDGLIELKRVHEVLLVCRRRG